MTLLSFCSYAQTESTKIFKKTEYINGNFYRELFDTINLVNEKIDIYFFKNHFYTPYYLPDKFVDKRYKNQKITIWRDPKGKKNHEKNWENTFIYDSLNRVINFTYSSCIICNSFPYNYTVIYNSNGQVYQIANSINEQDGFKFYYNSKDEVERFEKYLFKKLETLITLVK